MVGVRKRQQKLLPMVPIVYFQVHNSITVSKIPFRKIKISSVSEDTDRPLLFIGGYMDSENPIKSSSPTYSLFC